MTLTLDAPLSHPTDVTPENHAAILNELRRLLKIFQSTPDAAEHARLRVRDWDLIIEEGAPVAQIFLDKGFDTLDSGALRARLRITFEECLVFHRWLLEEDRLAFWHDNCGIQVSSAGVEPPLRSVEDYQSVEGQRIHIERWTAESLPRSMEGSLSGLETADGVVNLVLQDGQKVVKVPLADVRRAWYTTLPLKPGRKGSPEGKPAKQPKGGKSKGKSRR